MPADAAFCGFSGEGVDESSDSVKCRRVALEVWDMRDAVEPPESRTLGVESADHHQGRYRDLA